MVQKPDLDNASMCDTRATDRASLDDSASEEDQSMGTDIASRKLSAEELRTESKRTKKSRGKARRAEQKADKKACSMQPLAEDAEGAPSSARGSKDPANS